MGTTSHYSFRYPSFTADPPDGATQIQNLATDVDTTLFARLAALPKVQYGTASVSVTAANTPTSTTVTFPVAFGATPAVTVSGHLVVPHLTCTIGIAGVTTTSFAIVFERTDGATTISVDWIAVAAS